MLASLLSFGCVGDKPRDTGDTDDTGEPGPECALDDECGSGRICELEECIDGDRDNGFTSANPIFEADEAVSGEINPSGDKDFYVYTSTGDEWIRVETTSEGADEGLDTVVAIYTAGGSLHAYMDNYATGRVNSFDSVLHAYLPAAGEYFFTVEDVSTWYDLEDRPPVGDRTFDYTLDLRRFTGVTAEDDAIDNPSEQIDMTSGSSIWSVGVKLGTPGDADYVSIDLPWTGAPLEIYGQAEIPGSDARAQVNLYTVDGEMVLSKPDVGPDGAATLYRPGRAAYVLEATDADARGGADYWYVLYLRTRNETYWRDEGWELELEDNDTFETAQLLIDKPFTTSAGADYRGAFVLGDLDSASDSDFYAMNVFADAWITVRCSAEVAGSLADLALELLGPDGTVLATETDGDDSTPDLFNFGQVDAGVYQFRLYGEDELFGPGAYYRCAFYATTFEVAVE